MCTADIYALVFYRPEDEMFDGRWWKKWVAHVDFSGIDDSVRDQQIEGTTNEDGDVADYLDEKSFVCMETCECLGDGRYGRL